MRVKHRKLGGDKDLNSIPMSTCTRLSDVTYRRRIKVTNAHVYQLHRKIVLWNLGSFPFVFLYNYWVSVSSFWSQPPLKQCLFSLFSPCPMPEFLILAGISVLCWLLRVPWVSAGVQGIPVWAMLSGWALTEFRCLYPLSGFGTKNALFMVVTGIWSSSVV